LERGKIMTMVGHGEQQRDARTNRIHYRISKRGRERGSHSRQSLQIARAVRHQKAGKGPRPSMQGGDRKGKTV